MAIGSGLAGQFGMAVESTYGTAVSPTRFLEFNTESLKPDIARLESKGIGTGRYLRSGRHKEYVRGAGGSVEFDVMTKGFGLPLKMALGSNTVTQVASGAEYKHLIVPDSAALTGLFFTSQVGRPDVGGTVRPYTYEGCKVVSWELKFDVDNWVKLTLELDAETEQNSTSLASASYATGAEPFSFNEGGITIGGATVYAKRGSIKGSNGLRTDRRFVGNVKKEPIANAEWVVSGELEFEFEGLTRHAAQIAGTEFDDLVVTFTSPTLTGEGEGAFKLVTSVAAAFWQGGDANVTGPDVLPETLQFKAVNNGSDPVVQLEYHTTDTAA